MALTYNIGLCTGIHGKEEGVGRENWTPWLLLTYVPIISCYNNLTKKKVNIIENSNLKYNIRVVVLFGFFNIDALRLMYAIKMLFYDQIKKFGRKSCSTTISSVQPTYMTLAVVVIGLVRILLLYYNL